METRARIQKQELTIFTKEHLATRTSCFQTCQKIGKAHRCVIYARDAINYGAYPTTSHLITSLALHNIKIKSITTLDAVKMALSKLVENNHVLIRWILQHTAAIWVTKKLTLTRVYIYAVNTIYIYILHT